MSESAEATSEGVIESATEAYMSGLPLIQKVLCSRGNGL